MRFSAVPFTNVRRRPVRSVLTAGGVGVAVASYLLLTGLIGGVADSWTGNMSDRGSDMLVTRRHAVEILTSSIDEAMVAALGREPEIAAAAGELGDLMPLETGQTVLICGWDPDGFLWRTLEIRSGRMPATSDELVVGNRIAAELGVAIGSKIRVLDREYAVSGIVNRAGVLMGNALVLRLEAVQQLLGRPGQVTVIHARLSHAGDQAATDRDVASLAARFTGLDFVQSAEVAVQNRMLGLLRAAAWLSGTIGLIMGAVVLINTLLMSVTERAREIATLTALGWSSGRIVLMIMTEALYLAMAGAIVGLAAGTAGVYWMAKASAVRGFVTPHVNAAMLLDALAMSVVVAVLASVYPAWRATSIPASSALRHE